jgi:hypothetical protein
MICKLMNKIQIDGIVGSVNSATTNSPWCALTDCPRSAKFSGGIFYVANFAVMTDGHSGALDLRAGRIRCGGGHDQHKL